MRPLSHRDHRKFVETEGWVRTGTARRPVGTGDHSRYTLRLATGDILRTRVSHGSGAIEDPKLVAAVLRTQLQVSEVDFYRCVEDGILPPRPSATGPSVPDTGVEAWLVRNLLLKVGLQQHELVGLTQEQALQVWHDFLAAGG